MSGNYSIEDASREVGCKPALLRMWEMRYGWPRPQRDPHNNFRSFTPQLVAQIKQVMAIVKAGTPIGKLTKDGVPDLTGGLPPIFRALIISAHRDLALARACLRMSPEQYWSTKGTALREEASARGQGDEVFDSLHELREQAALVDQFRRENETLRAQLRIARMTPPTTVIIPPIDDREALKAKLEAALRQLRHATEVTIPVLSRQLMDQRDRERMQRRELRESA